MAKSLRQINLSVSSIKNVDDSWGISIGADLTVGFDEYPDIQPIRNGIPITLTPDQVIILQNFMATIIIPQAIASVAKPVVPNNMPQGIVIPASAITVLTVPTIAK